MHSQSESESSKKAEDKKMSNNAELRINLGVLQQNDPFIVDILATARQVALYSFNSAKKEWEKTEIEGTMFTYKRSVSPTHGFMILNRLGRNNLVEPILTSIEFQPQKPFLLYRNGEGKIYGIWFYDTTECDQITQLMSRLISSVITTKVNRSRTVSDGEVLSQQEIQNGSVNPGFKLNYPESGSSNSKKESDNSKNGSSLDLLQMLTKAYQDFDLKQTTGPKSMTDKPATKIDGTSAFVKPLALRPSGDNNVSSTQTVTRAVEIKKPIKIMTRPSDGSLSTKSSISPSVKQHGGVEHKSSVVANTDSRPVKEIWSVNADPRTVRTETKPINISQVASKISQLMVSDATPISLDQLFKSASLHAQSNRPPLVTTSNVVNTEINCAPMVKRLLSFSEDMATASQLDEQEVSNTVGVTKQNHPRRMSENVTHSSNYMTHAFDKTQVIPMNIETFKNNEQDFFVHSNTTAISFKQVSSNNSASLDVTEKITAKPVFSLNTAEKMSLKKSSNEKCSDSFKTITNPEKNVVLHLNNAQPSLKSVGSGLNLYEATALRAEDFEHALRTGNEAKTFSIENVEPSEGKSELKSSNFVLMTPQDLTLSGRQTNSNWPVSLPKISSEMVLLPPTDFVQTNKTLPASPATTATVPFQSVPVISSTVPVVNDVAPENTSLNKEQLRTALIDLLKSDEDFLTTIHNAYLQRCWAEAHLCK